MVREESCLAHAGVEDHDASPGLRTPDRRLGGCNGAHKNTQRNDLTLHRSFPICCRTRLGIIEGFSEAAHWFVVDTEGLGWELKLSL